MYMRWCPDGDFLAIFWVQHFQRAACSTFQSCDSVTARHSSSGRQPNFAALNRGRHLYSAGRPSLWASTHILLSVSFSSAVFGLWGFPQTEPMLCLGTPTENFRSSMPLHGSNKSYIAFRLHSCKFTQIVVTCKSLTKILHQYSLK